MLAVVLLGPTLVNRPAVQAEIQQRLSKALQGQVTWEALDVALFPAPHGELRKLRVDIPDRLGATADQVDVYLRLWPLLRGRADFFPDPEEAGHQAALRPRAAKAPAAMLRLMR